MPAPQTSATSVTYCNPLNVRIADPFVLSDGGKYYLYGTTATERGFLVYTSEDLVNWKDTGLCYTKSAQGWPQRDFWAPEVAKRDETYYLYFAAQHEPDGDRNICVATATAPGGPFTLIKAPMLPGGSYIDAHVFRDAESGAYYGYLVGEGRTPNGIYGASLDSSMTSFTTTPSLVLKATQPWESNWVEAPFVVPHGGKFYMMYSGNAYFNRGYGVGYAIGESPLGPFEKSSENPLLHYTEDVSGPGHHCVVQPADSSDYFLLYHRHATPQHKSRVLAIDLLRFEKNPAGGEDRMVMQDAPSCTTRTLQLQKDR